MLTCLRANCISMETFLPEVKIRQRKTYAAKQPTNQHAPGASVAAIEGSLHAIMKYNHAHASLKRGNPPPAGNLKNGLARTLWPSLAGSKRPMLPAIYIYICMCLYRHHTSTLRDARKI